MDDKNKVNYTNCNGCIYYDYGICLIKEIPSYSTCNKQKELTQQDLNLVFLRLIANLQSTLDQHDL